jgi:hypothetical protein
MQDPASREIQDRSGKHTASCHGPGNAITIITEDTNPPRRDRIVSEILVARIVQSGDHTEGDPGVR